MEPLYLKRQQRLIADLQKRGMEKMLIGNPLNIYYLTGIMIKPYERFLALLVDAAKTEYTMIVPGLEQGIAVKEGIPELAVSDVDDPLEKLAGLLTNAESLAVEMAFFPMAMGIGLQRRLPAVHLMDCSGMIDTQRIIKDDYEIELIHQAARYGDMILAENQAEIREGNSEKELQFSLLKSMAEKPGVSTDPFIIQVLSGMRSSNPHGGPGPEKFHKGDPVTIDYGVYYKYYWSDYCRTFFIGRPDPRLERIYRVVLEAQLAAIDRVRPGIAMQEIDLAARRIIEKAGFGEQFIHRTGHGLGLDVHEEPKITSRNEGLLEEGMVFTIEPGIYLPGLGGVRIEDDVVVTSRGAMVLNSFPKDFSDMVLA